VAERAFLVVTPLYFKTLDACPYSIREGQAWWDGEHIALDGVE
jgi:hypothetical protein